MGFFIALTPKVVTSLVSITHKYFFMLSFRKNSFDVTDKSKNFLKRKETKFNERKSVTFLYFFSISQVRNRKKKLFIFHSSSVINDFFVKDKWRDERGKGRKWKGRKMCKKVFTDIQLSFQPIVKSFFFWRRSMGFFIVIKIKYGIFFKIKIEKKLFLSALRNFDTWAAFYIIISVYTQQSLVH